MTIPIQCMAEFQWMVHSISSKLTIFCLELTLGLSI